MITLRKCILEMYDVALKNVIKHIEIIGYISFHDADRFLQKQFERFEKYYMKKYRVDPFDHDFVHIVFDEFFENVRKIKGMQIKKLSKEDVDLLGYDEIYGFDQEAIERGYRRLVKEAKEADV